MYPAWHWNCFSHTIYPEQASTQESSATVSACSHPQYVTYRCFVTATGISSGHIKNPIECQAGTPKPSVLESDNLTR